MSSFGQRNIISPSQFGAKAVGSRAKIRANTIPGFPSTPKMKRPKIVKNARSGQKYHWAGRA